MLRWCCLQSKRTTLAGGNIKVSLAVDLANPSPSLAQLLTPAHNLSHDAEAALVHFIENIQRIYLIAM
jgi:hypothetical protein